MGATDVSRHLRERRTWPASPPSPCSSPDENRPHKVPDTRTVVARARPPAVRLDRAPGEQNAAYRARRTAGHAGGRPRVRCCLPPLLPCSRHPPGRASSPPTSAQAVSGVTSTGASFPASSSWSPCSLWVSCGPGCWPPAVRLADVRSAWNRAGGSRLSSGWSASKRQRTLRGHACSRRSVVTHSLVLDRQRRQADRTAVRGWGYKGTDTIRAEIHGKELGLSHRSALTTRTDYRYPQSVEDRNRRRAGRGLRSVHGAMVREQIRGPANGKVDCRRPPGRSAAVTGSRVLRSGRGATETGC